MAQAYTEVELKCYQSDVTSIDDSIRYCKKAAKAGDRHAQFKLATLYAQMPGGDLKASLKWLLLAAEQQHLEAQYNLASAYFYGQGVEVDYSLAADWYRKSANLGSARSQRNLAHMYETGTGVTANSRKSFLWYTKSAAQGLQDSQLKVGIMLYNGQGATSDQSEGIDWIRKAATGGNADAQFTLAAIIMPDVSVEAVAWYRQAVAQGHVHAMYNLARFLVGPGIYQDLDAAMLIVDQAVKAGHKESVELSAVISAAMSKAEVLGESVSTFSGDWLRDMPPENLTFQLVMSGSLVGVRQFIERHQISDKARIYMSEIDKEKTYVVLLGSFSDRWQIETAYADLPNSLENSRPLPKRAKQLIEDGYVVMKN